MTGLHTADPGIKCQESTKKNSEFVFDIWMLTGEIPEFVVQEGEEVVLSCPVNTLGSKKEDLEIKYFIVFLFRVWRVSLTEMVQEHPACLRLQSDGSLQPARGLPDGQVSLSVYQCHQFFSICLCRLEFSELTSWFLGVLTYLKDHWVQLAQGKILLVLWRI